jgi:glycosyltransferase involved in cell wall biosynthesis
MLSIITPAYNEAANLPLLHQRLSVVMNSIDVDWEWIIVDDHSTDDTFAVIDDLFNQDSKVRGFRLARNHGSHIAICCGLDHAKGACAAIMAADLQDPPETLPLLLKKWEAGAQVVWAVRAIREGEKNSTLLFSRLYYFLMRHVVGMKEMPATGADFFLIDRKVMKTFLQFRESNLSIMVLMSWMGFRQATITYDKQARLHGSSGWNLGKKIKLVVDSIVSFSYLPIRFMSLIGLVVSIFGFAYATVVLFNALRGHPVQGWTSLMLVLLIIGGLQMMMLGVLGEYIWRGLDESRRRPKYFMENSTGLEEE